jgi:hypothetical protein
LMGVHDGIARGLISFILSQDGQPLSPALNVLTHDALAFRR